MFSALPDGFRRHKTYQQPDNYAEALLESGDIGTTCNRRRCGTSYRSLANNDELNAIYIILAKISSKSGQNIGFSPR